MKTITEFSGTVLREAARIRKLHRPARPAKRPEAEQDPAPDAAAPAAEAAPATEAAPPASTEAQSPVEISGAARRRGRALVRSRYAGRRRGGPRRGGREAGHQGRPPGAAVRGAGLGQG